jgi:ABC-type multidrug transport system ATPase subunit
MLKLVKGIVKEHEKNIIFSSHILPDIEQICDKVVILNHGELVTTGNLKDLLYEKYPDIVVRVRGALGKFIQLLRENGFKSEKRKNDILIKYQPNITKQVIRLAAEAGVQLRYLNSSKRSLEELFIKLINKNESTKTEVNDFK